MLEGKAVWPQFACVPNLTRIVFPWAGATPWKPKRKHLKKRLAQTATAAGLQARAARALKWQEKDAEVGKLLNSSSWHQYLTAGGLTTYDRQLWHRLRLHQLHVWAGDGPQQQCGVDDCTTAPSTGAVHTFWHCTGARRLWLSLIRLWGTASLPDEALAHAIFTRTPPQTQHDWLGQLWSAIVSVISSTRYGVNSSRAPYADSGSPRSLKRWGRRAEQQRTTFLW